MPCFPISAGKMCLHTWKLQLENPTPNLSSATGKVADGCPDRAAALSPLNTSWFSEIICKSVVVEKRLLEGEGPFEPVSEFV